MSIDSYVAALDARLAGPKRVRAELITEARDSLHDAAESYRRGGLGEAEAERRAVAEFGSLPEIAAEFQAELAVAQGSRLLRTLLLALPALRLLWAMDCVGGGSEPTLPESLWWVTRLSYGAPLAVAALAALALLGGRWWSRRSGDSRALGRWVCLLGVAGVGMCLFATFVPGVALVAADPSRPWTSPALLGVLAATVVVMGRLLHLGRRCLSLAG